MLGCDMCRLREAGHCCGCIDYSRLENKENEDLILNKTFEVNKNEVYISFL